MSFNSQSQLTIATVASIVPSTIALSGGVSLRSIQRTGAKIPTLVLLVAISALVGSCSCASIDSDQSIKPDLVNLSKEEPQLSSTSGLVKRSAPSASSSYGHSIMRFGRAPHNIMHFGKRANPTTADSYLDSYLDPQNDFEAVNSGEAAINSVPEWILGNLLANKGAAAAPSAGARVTRYLLVPVSGRDTAQPQSYYYPAAAAKSTLGASPIKKAKLTEESDNVFMHFG